jgi:hypothetical protein
MYRYLDKSETPKDKAHQKIMEELNIFMGQRPSAADRQILSNMVLECIHKHGESIKSMEKDDPGLLTPLIMALIVEQNSMIDRLEDNKG